MTAWIKNYLRIILLLICCVCTAFSAVHISPQVSNAEEISFTESNVLDDLKSSTVNGEKFNLSDYPFDEDGEMKVINVVEYCYSYKKNKLDNYGLYIYLYNPKGLSVNENSGQNKIQMSTYEDSDGLHYDKFKLQFINKSESSSYKRLFYKFKVIDAESADGKSIVERLNSNERVYNISGLEIQITGNQNATEIGVGGKYVFSGYAKGYGPDVNAESNLSCVCENIETLQLEVHHTYFRTNVSSKGAGHYNEVNTVYFSVPERIFTEYGNLQKIHAEWWEYKTKPIFVTSNAGFYSEFKKYTGIDVGEYSSSVPVYLYHGCTVSDRSTTTKTITSTHYDWAFNIKEEEINRLGYYDKTDIDAVCSMIPYAFYSEGIGSDKGVFDWLTSTQNVGNVESIVLKEYMYHYSNDLGNGTIDCNGRNISKDLFENSVDEGRTMGYNNMNIDLADTFNLMSYDSNHTWWDKLWEYGFSWPTTSGDYYNIAPIYILDSSDITGTNQTISEHLLVNENDVSALKTYYATETLKGNKVVLFRFASTDYYVENVGCAGSGFNIKESSDTAYIAQETVFFDFDIIDLTFNKAGVYHVIPVVSDPIDIVNSITAPTEETEWWKILLGILLVVLLIVLLSPLIPYLIKGVVWLISLPVKLFQYLKGKRNNDKRVTKQKEKEPHKET